MKARLNLSLPELQGIITDEHPAASPGKPVLIIGDRVFCPGDSLDIAALVTQGVRQAAEFSAWGWGTSGFKLSRAWADWCKTFKERQRVRELMQRGFKE